LFIKKKATEVIETTKQYFRKVRDLLEDTHQLLSFFSYFDFLSVKLKFA